MQSRSIVILCLDSYGDLTLRQPLFRSLLAAGSRLGIVVRTPHEALLPFLDERIEAIAVDLNPYQAPDAAFWARAAELQRRIEAFAPDLLVCGLYNRTFLDQWLLRCSPAPTLSFGNPGISDADLDALAPASSPHKHGDLGPQVSVAEDTSEVDRNRALLEAIQGAAADEYQPRLQLGQADEERARGALARLSLEAGRYAFGAPAGIVNNPLKAWRPEVFLEVAEHLEKRHGLATLVTGVASEAEGLDALVRRGAERGLRISRWIGGADDLGELLGLVRFSRMYVGSDTGPMHFAAALDVPLLALFGGGHWPRFLPVARRSFVATRQLPCFGCDWECWLPEAACITTVDTRVLLDGADWLLDEHGPDRRVDMGPPIPEQAQKMVRDGAARYRMMWGRVVRGESYQRMLEGYRDFLLDQKRLLEEERDALRAHMEAQRRSYEDSLQATEIEKARRLRIIVQQEVLIGNLGGQINRLSTARGAFRVLSAKAMRKVGVFDVLHRSQERRKARKQRGGPGAAARSAPAPAEPTPAGATRFLDAFVMARSLPGGTPDLALGRLHELGGLFPSVLCVHTTPRGLQAAVMLASGGARVTWLGEASDLRGLDAAGLEAQADLGPLLVAAGRETIEAGTALLLDADGDEEKLRLLGYRLPPNTTLLVIGGDSRAPWAESLPTATERTEAFSVHAAPPAAWRDPAGGDPAYRGQRLWLAAPRAIQLPERLPSGRPWPRISIVTVTLNQARFLEQTLLSVLRQDYPDLEYIVLDGGSTDGTAEILERYRPRLTHCTIGKDEGQSDALNKGFALATGQILAWLNSDDRYPAGALWRVAAAFDCYPADMVVGGCRLVRGERDETVHVHHSALPVGRLAPLPLERILDLEGSWLKGDFFFQPEVFWTREIWERSGGGVAKELFYSMDYELWARMAHEGARAVHLPDTLALYRMHEGQKTAGVHLPYLPELRRVAAGLRRRWSIP